MISQTLKEATIVFIAKDYDLRLDAPACEPGAEYWNATATFKDDISDVFPYLNAEWNDVIYSPGANQITWRFDEHAVAAKPHEITISYLPDRDTATLQLEKIIAEINRIWMDRQNLTPVHTPRKRLIAMEVYQLLPQTNCKLCGQATCFAFASKITVGEADIKACTPLFEEDQYAAKRQAVMEMLAASVGYAE
jgi:ArsR family metal-binding transcriptional regulator